jgi:TfdA family taurine catabolism dioxygenase TauD
MLHSSGCQLESRIGFAVKKAQEAKSMPLNTQPLSDKFGVAIIGVDLSKEPDEKLFNEIVDIFVKNQVLVFRDQHIEPQHQVAFSRRFGPLEMLYDEDQRVPGFPEIAILSNEKVDGKLLASSRPAISGTRTSPTDKRVRSRLCSMPTNYLSTAAIQNSPICRARMKVYPMTSKSASTGAWASISAASWAIHASR